MIILKASHVFFSHNFFLIRTVLKSVRVLVYTLFYRGGGFLHKRLCLLLRFFYRVMDIILLNMLFGTLDLQAANCGVVIREVFDFLILDLMARRDRLMNWLLYGCLLNFVNSSIQLFVGIFLGSLAISLWIGLASCAISHYLNYSSLYNFYSLWNFLLSLQTGLKIKICDDLN